MYWFKDAVQVSHGLFEAHTIFPILCELLYINLWQEDPSNRHQCFQKEENQESGIPNL